MANTPPIEPLHQPDFPRIVDVWEASVRATHHFLPEADIQLFRPLILNQYLYLVQLFGVRNDEGEVMGFLGVADNKIEMLFLHPDWCGRGVGRRLVDYAVAELGATEVDVNEQNEQAVGFYGRVGFTVVGRSPVDGMGNPYPLLHMRVANDH